MTLIEEKNTKDFERSLKTNNYDKVIARRLKLYLTLQWVPVVHVACINTSRNFIDIELEKM